LGAGIAVVGAGGVVLIPGAAHATRLPGGMLRQARPVREFRDAIVIPQSFITTGHPVVGSRVFVRGRPMRIASESRADRTTPGITQADVEYFSEDRLYRWQLSCVGAHVCGGSRSAGAGASQEEINRANAECSRGETGYSGPVINPTPTECANLPVERLAPGQQGRVIDPRFDR